MVKEEDKASLKLWELLLLLLLLWLFFRSWNSKREFLGDKTFLPDQCPAQYLDEILFRTEDRLEISELKRIRTDLKAGLSASFFSEVAFF